MFAFSIFEHLKQVSRCKYIEYSSNTKNKFEIFSTNNKKIWSKHELNSSARLRV